MRLRCHLVLLALCAGAAGQVSAQPRNDQASPQESLPEALSKLERALERSARAAAAGVERGLLAAERGVRVGAAAAARGVERGANAAAKAAERVARELERRAPASPPPGSERTIAPSQRSHERSDA